MPGGTSRLVTFLLLTMFHPIAMKFETLGVRVPVGNDGPLVHFNATLGAFIADETAQAELASGKGASATRPCPCCQHVVGRCGPATVLPGTLVH